MTMSPTDTATLYFNPRLRRALAALGERPITVVEAPMGYGKTVAVRNHLRQAGRNTILTTALDAGADLFWSDLCRNLARALPGRSGTVAALERLGYPRDAARTAEAYILVRDLDLARDTVLVFDDLHFLPTPTERAPSGLVGLCELLARRSDDAPRMVLLSRNAYPGDGDMLTMKGLLATVGRETLALDESDIAEYYRLSGVALPNGDARQLFERTDGWISALYLCLLHYGKHGVVADPETLDRLVEREVFEPMPAAARELLLKLYPLERFTRNQAEFLHGGADVRPLLDELLRVNSFLRHDEADGSFALHAIARENLARRFAALPEERRRDMVAACAECAIADGDALTALRLCRDSGRHERAFDVLEGELGHKLLTKDMDTINALFESCPPELLEKRLSAAFVHAIHSFTAGDFETFGRRLAWLAEKCAAMPEDDAEADAWRGELEFLLSLAAYNDIAAMSRHHRRANELLRGRPTRLFIPESPWTLGSPSVLFMFHRDSGRLDEEIRLMHECLPHYYRLAGGHGSGGEHIMEAEALYHRGDFAEAALAARRAEAFAQAKGQLGNVLAALFVRQRLALAEGGYREARAILDDMRGRIRDRNEYYYLHTVDLCEGQMLAAIGRAGDAAEWLKRGMGGEDRLYNFAGGYYFIVHGGVLLAEKRWEEAIGLCSWLIASRTFDNNLLSTIHARICLAAAHQALRREREAGEELAAALELALPDGLVMPFVENWRYLAAIPPLAGGDPAPSGMAALRRLANKWEKRRCGVIARHFPGEKPVLTRRELQLARLAMAGKRFQEIADEIHLAHSTVKRAFVTMYAKLGISSREELESYLEKFDGGRHTAAPDPIAADGEFFENERFHEDDTI